MRKIQLRSLKNQRVIADQCFVAERFFDRLRGLIGTREFPEGRGLFFPDCNDIHMWFMSIPIDVVFVRPDGGAKDNGAAARSYVVTSVHRGVQPWRALPLLDSKATDTIELPLGAIERADIASGDTLCLS